MTMDLFRPMRTKCPSLSATALDVFQIAGCGGFLQQHAGNRHHDQRTEKERGQLEAHAIGFVRRMIFDF